MQEYADTQTQQREAKAKADVEKVFDTVEIRVQVRPVTASLAICLVC